MAKRTLIFAVDVEGENPAVLEKLLTELSNQTDGRLHAFGFLEETNFFKAVELLSLVAKGPAVPK